MIIVKFHPIKTSSAEKEFEISNEFFSGVINWQLATKNNVWLPPYDLLETDNEFLVRVEIAGMCEDDFSITVDRQKLMISGMRRDESTFRTFHQLEIFFGEFSFEIDLPSAINVNQVTGEYQNGFLLITLPKIKTISVPINQE